MKKINSEGHIAHTDSETTHVIFDKVEAARIKSAIQRLGDMITSTNFQPGVFMPVFNSDITLIESLIKSGTCSLETKLCNLLLGERIPLDIIRASDGFLLIPAYRFVTKTLIRKLIKYRHDYEIAPSPLRNRIRAIMEEYL